MAFLTDPRMATVSLTRGGQWTHEIRVDPGKVWPPGTARIVFYDSRGGIITTLDGEADDQNLSFTSGPADTDDVPAGAGFEVFLTTADGPYKVRYGKVIRKEVGFPAAPGSVINPSDALQFTDNFQRTALGSRWIPIVGRSRIYENPLTVGAPNGVANDFPLLWGSSAIRYFAPINGDTVKVSVNIIYPASGQTTVIFAADQALTSYIGLQFDTGSFLPGLPAAQLRIVTGAGGPLPADQVHQASHAATFADFDNWTIFYNNLSKVAMIYKGTNTTPIVQWQDDTGLVPHGLGYRYLGFSWAAGLLATGPQITDWIAQDDVAVIDAMVEGS